MKYSWVIIILLFSCITKLVNADIQIAEDNLFYQQMNSVSSLTEKQSEQRLQQGRKAIESLTDEIVVEKVSISSFHKQEKSLNQLNTSICSQCHNQWPHEKNTRLRSMLNMHNKKLVCETCHFSLSKADSTRSIKEFDFDYVDFLDSDNNKISLIAPFYNGKAAYLDKYNGYSKALTSQWKTTLDYLQGAVKAESSSSKSTDYKVINTKANDSELNLTINTEEQAEQHALQLYSQVHKPLVANENLVQCDDCHSRSGTVLDLSKLSNDKDRIEGYQNNVISNFFSRYKEDDQTIKIINLLR